MNIRKGINIVPISEFLKSAASQLRRAAEERKREVDDLRSQIKIKEQEMRSRIADISQNEQVRNTQMLQSEINSAQKAVVAGEIANLEKEKTELKHSFDHFKRGMEQRARQMEQQINDLNQQASSFENRAATADS
jgi:DNA repair exonuclease SbcCD ATPase subunit